MKKTSLWLSVLFATLTAQGQEFVLQGGSTGADGPLDVTEDTTLPLPPDGIFNYTTVTIAEGATLRFERNALNTPVYLLATGDVNIEGDIDVAGRNGSGLAGGKGGPGGFDGGRPGFTSASPPGAGFGPGGGLGGTRVDSGSGAAQEGAGSGAFRSRPVQQETNGTSAGPGSSGYSNNHGDIYGNGLLRPLIGGSGGGGAAGSPGIGGGGGGGAILIGSPTQIILNGRIVAWGAQSADRRNVDNGGSGGGVRIVAPIFAGAGEINVTGGSNDDGEFQNNHAGHGRIRVDAFELEGAVNMSFTPAASLSAGSSVFVFPLNRPAIEIVAAAGTEIPSGTQGPVRLNLPFDSPTAQTVRLRASNFGGVVPVSVVVTPAQGTPQEFQAEIDNGASNPAEVDVAIEVPTNVQVTLQVWSR